MSEWIQTNIGDVATVFDGPHATPKKTETGPWFLSISSLDKGRLNLAESAHVSEEDFGHWTRRVTPREGDVLFSYETRLGEAALMPSGIRACLGRRMGILRPKTDRVHPQFLLYAYLGPEFQETIAARTIHGATVDRIPLASLSTWPIRLPGLAEQRAIVSVLGALDEKIAVNERIAATADELSRALFTREFPISAASVPQDGWVPGYLSDLCSTQYGYTASSTSEPVGPKFLRVKDINKRNWVNWADVPHCEISERDREKYQLSIGDVLVARMADPGKSTIVEEATDAVFASYLVRLKTPSLAHSYFVWGFLKSDAYVNYAESSRGGSVQANMNAKVIVGAQLLIPPVEMMQRYLRLVTPVRQRLTLALGESQTLAALRDTLLPQLMSGRLRVKDAEKIVEDAT
ncbi:restriction endonuclease subunit S [Streptomyces sp. NPDC058891]|uniref:restriction endonuclease subunit S n=1 Tax=Streptomyces sp. NPDC058891 TaxID=3346667 RepID=UPI0036C3DCF0